MFEKALVEYARKVEQTSQFSRTGTVVGDVVQVAARHDCTLNALPDGVRPDSPVKQIDGGYNGKRPSYWIVGTTVFAEGTFFGNNSRFDFLSDDALDRVAEEILPPGTLSRVRLGGSVGQPPLIVTRHAGAIKWLRLHGVEGDVVSHVTPDDIRGRVVVGNLPVALAALCSKYGAVDLPDLRPEDRGRDLAPEEMDSAGAILRWFMITEL